jgi:hypothetical protein
VTNTRAGDTADGLRIVAAGPSESFSLPRHKRRAIITSVCDRLVVDLDRSLQAARELCSSLDSGFSGGSGGSCDRDSQAIAGAQRIWGDRDRAIGAHPARQGGMRWRNKSRLAR